MINRIKSAVNFIANNQVQGNITPVEFNIALNNAMMNIYDGYFSELNRLLVMENKGHIHNGLSDAPAKLREQIQYYLSRKDIVLNQDSGSGLSFKAPEDCRFVDGIFINDNSASVEIADNSLQFEMIKRFKNTRPTLRYPIGIRFGNSFNLMPEGIENVTIYYLRNPKHPNWTYRILPGNTAELFNPSDPTFQDVDMHVSEESRLILGVLIQFGINLKDMELLQSAQMYAQQEAQKNII